MHIPDGFLSLPVWATLDALAIPAVAFVARRAQRDAQEDRAPLLGVMGAFVFAAQMINFPVGIGTSGHLVGGALLAFTVGPYAASVVLTAILILQALLFQDGGVLALGANVTNMALAGVLVASLVVRVFPASREKLGYFTGAALSLLVSATLALAELLTSGVRMPVSALALSLGLFAVSAVMEGAITVAVLGALQSLSSRYVRIGTQSRRPAPAALLLLSVVLAAAGFLFASTKPDALWSLAGAVGWTSHAHSAVNSPLADYKAPFLNQAWLSHAAAGLAGLMVIYLICLLLSRLVVRRRVQYSRGG